MTEPQKAMIKTLLVILLGAAALVFVLKAEAAPPWYGPGVPGTDGADGADGADGISCFCSSSGLSDDDIADIVSGSLAGGAHQFDWSTTRWQLSVTGATSTDELTEHSNFSFAIGRKFGKDSWAPNALWHVGGTTSIQGNNYVMGGATVVLER